MKKLSFILLIILVIFLIFIILRKNNISINNKNNDNLNIITTIFPQYDFVRQIAKDKVNLEMLLPLGSESHSFEPTPQDIIKIKNCDVFIYVGGESDAWIDTILESMDTSNKKIISLMDLVDVVEEKIVEGMEDEEEKEERESDEKDIYDDGEIEYDEHVWTSIKNARQIVQSISDILCELDAKNADFYKQNTIEYIEKLENLENEYRKIVETSKRKIFVFGDRFPFRYFADEFGLEYYAAFPGCSSQTEASAATIKFLIDKVKAEKIPVVFFIEFSNEKISDIICESTGAKKLILHSCHNVSKKDFDMGTSYLDLMTKNLDNFREALN
ncbi:MAG: metal ABC transporter substrate-binding protein [Elusimicrobiota bacterium]|jgi:zinc transport system substrate-binding protein|nr:metal ABC transporter substrate-binding protein [Elusimicrobiota bacterium]